ncbi:MAG: DUF1330 domain-containing protein [Bacteroidales bacterium]|nr:DUF1330 domain-containing protein [Bacteroidales bacterium]
MHTTQTPLKVQLLIIGFVTIVLQSSGQNPSINCRWFSAKSEPSGQAFVTRDFTFNKNNWTLCYTMYADSTRLFPIFSFDAEGTFTVGKRIKKLQAAWEADFTFKKKFLTLHTNNPHIIKQLGFESCNLQTETKTDISANGCSFLQSVAQYETEYDIVMKSGNNLMLGNRPADNNLGNRTARPSQPGELLEPFDETRHQTNILNPVMPILHPDQCFVLIKVNIKDQEKFMQYVTGHLGTITLYGGKIIFEGMDKTSYEGEAKDYNFMVIQQWPDQKSFDAWWNSPEYARWKNFRSQGADVTVELVKQRGDMK